MGCCTSKSIEPPTLRGTPTAPCNGHELSTKEHARKTVVNNVAFAQVTDRRGVPSPKDGPGDGSKPPAERAALTISPPRRASGNRTPRQKDGQTVLQQGTDHRDREGAVRHETFQQPSSRNPRGRDDVIVHRTSPQTRTATMLSGTYGFESPQAESRDSSTDNVQPNRARRRPGSLRLSGGTSMEESTDADAEDPAGFEVNTIGECEIDASTNESQTTTQSQKESTRQHAKVARNVAEEESRVTDAALKEAEERAAANEIALRQAEQTRAKGEAARLQATAEAERKELAEKRASNEIAVRQTEENRVAAEAAVCRETEKKTAAASTQQRNEKEEEAAAAVQEDAPAPDDDDVYFGFAVGDEVELVAGFEDMDPEAVYGPLGDGHDTGKIVATEVIEGEEVVTVATSESQYKYRRNSLQKVHKRERSRCTCRRAQCVCGGQSATQPQPSGATVVENSATTPTPTEPTVVTTSAATTPNAIQNGQEQNAILTKEPSASLPSSEPPSHSNLTSVASAEQMDVTTPPQDASVEHDDTLPSPTPALSLQSARCTCRRIVCVCSVEDSSATEKATEPPAKVTVPDEAVVARVQRRTSMDAARMALEARIAAEDGSSTVATPRGSTTLPPTPSPHQSNPPRQKKQYGQQSGCTCRRAVCVCKSNDGVHAKVSTAAATEAAVPAKSAKEADREARANWWAEEQKRRAAASGSTTASNEPTVSNVSQDTSWRLKSPPTSAAVAAADKDREERDRKERLDQLEGERLTRERTDREKQLEKDRIQEVQAERSRADRQRSEADRTLRNHAAQEKEAQRKIEHGRSSELAQVAPAVSPSLTDDATGTSQKVARRTSMQEARALLEARMASEESPRAADPPKTLRRNSVETRRASLEAQADPPKTLPRNTVETRQAALKARADTGESDQPTTLSRGSFETDRASSTEAEAILHPAAPVQNTGNNAVTCKQPNKTAEVVITTTTGTEHSAVPGRLAHAEPDGTSSHENSPSVKRRGTSFFRKNRGSQSPKRASFFSRKKNDVAHKSPLVVVPKDTTKPPHLDIGSVVNLKHAAKVWQNTRMQTVAEILAGGDDDHEWEEMDPRAIDAAQWTDKEISRVIDQVKLLGTLGRDGKYEVSFGRMFVETSQIFDALSGILKTAKKYGVVEFEGEQLWQGQNDDTVIRLVKQVHSGIKIKRRQKKDLKSAPKDAKTSGFGHGFEQGAKCTVCTKTIYQAEWVGAGGKSFHKSCFRCAGCNKMLQQADYFVSFDRKFRCKRCHNESESQGR
eukprot:m.379770 g.379770  ORF g.379770 m.379770 type:complete len:1270 (+) comp28230_c0_seq24:374-4183(+)